MTSRFFIKLAYRGDNYHGWQKQENARSVQETIETALSNLFSMPIEVTGCGRTDTGVHATEYFAHADLPSDIEPSHAVYKLNKMLPKDIGVMAVLPVQQGAHARFDATSRTYDYRICRTKDPFKNAFTYYYYGRLDLHKMNECANLLLDVSDFSAFSKSNTQVNNNICKLFFAGWTEHENEYVFTISANRFLRNMVRAVVGTLLEVGKEKMNRDEFMEVVKGGNRSDAGTSVPACGLYLRSIQYPESLFIR